MKKAVLIDTSSAILLFKSDWMAPLMEHYQVGTGPMAFGEMTVPHHPGATDFARWQNEQRLLLHPTHATVVESTDEELQRLDPGERECIHLYYSGAGAFIIIDDGPGAAFCRKRAVPYVSALLVPRLLHTGPAGDVAAAVHAIYASGRYAPWVLEYALNCPAEHLAFYLP